MDESGTDEAECSRKVASGRRVAGDIVCSLQLECVRVLHELLPVPVLTYSINIMIWREKERSRIWCCTEGQPHRIAGYQENG